MVILEDIRVGDMLLHGGQKCVVIYRLRRDAALEYYHTRRPVFRCRFLRGKKGVMLSPETAGEFRVGSREAARRGRSITPEDFHFLEELAMHVR